MSGIALEPTLINFEDMVDLNNTIIEIKEETPNMTDENKSRSYYFCSDCNITLSMNTKYKHMKTISHLRTMSRDKGYNRKQFEISSKLIFE